MTLDEAEENFSVLIYDQAGNTARWGIEDILEQFEYQREIYSWMSKVHVITNEALWDLWARGYNV